MSGLTSRDLVAAHEVAQVMEHLLQSVDFSALDATHMADLAHLCTNRLETQTTASVRRQLGGEDEVRKLGRQLAEDLLLCRGFYSLLQDETVSDVLVNGTDPIYVERGGRLARSDWAFPSAEVLERTARWMTARVGRPIHRDRPMVDARLPDGSRLNVIGPPLALDGTVLSIRRFRHTGLDLAGLVTSGALPVGWDRLLHACVAGRLSVLVAGGTGAGKTTFLNAISEAIGDHERVITIEDAAELRLRQEHVVRLETRVQEGDGASASTRDLVRNALRMRPDRILVGEVRGPEALDMIQAMNTGHEGSMSTIHANSPRDALDRLEVMVGMASLGLPGRLVRSQIARSLDVLIHLRRLSDGRRVVGTIAEVGLVQGEVIALQDLLRYEDHGAGPTGTVSGRFVATGVRPSFVDRLLAAGQALPPGLWQGTGAR